MSLVPQHLYPFESHYLKLGKLNYHYLDEGEGEPIVMVHGNPTWSFYYRRLVQAFSGTHRCIVPDHIGCGMSDKPGDEDYSYTLKSRIDDLEKLIDSLDLKSKITLIVHDWGGMIGMGWATRHPERVRRIVILNTGAFHLPASRAFHWQLSLARNSSVGGFLVRRFNAFSRTATWVCCTRKRLSKELRDAYAAPYNSYENRIATLRFVQDIPLKAGDPAYEVVSDIESKLAQFNDLPVMICWGDKDFVFDDHFLQEWKRILPEAKVHQFADCGHYVLEDAAEEIQELVGEFLETT